MKKPLFYRDCGISTWPEYEYRDEDLGGTPVPLPATREIV